VFRCLGRAAAQESGFTLVELLAVTVIVVVLSLICLQVFDDVVDRARWARSRDELRTIEVGLERYRTDHAHYPDRLESLAKEGYLKANTEFASPWSSSKRRQYYFYAVDDSDGGKAMAYGLGDPGPKANCSVSRNQQPQLTADASVPLPCGRNPSQRAWSFYVDADLHVVGALQVSRGHATLRSFRSSCGLVQESAIAVNTGCDLRTES